MLRLLRSGVLAISGTGIPAAALDSIFEPTFARKGSRVKAGLGLFTSSNILRRHAGQITVESRPGEGSTFTVSFPADLESPPGVGTQELVPAATEDEPCPDDPASRCARLEPS